MAWHSMKVRNCTLETDNVIPEEYLDPITMNIMVEPVVLLQTGMTYDLHSIMEWFERGHDTCPLTNVRLTDLVAERDQCLKSEIQRWQERHGLGAEPQGPEGPQVYRFRQNMYGKRPGEPERFRHEWEVEYAHERISQLLGRRTALQMTLRQAQDGRWLCPLDCSSDLSVPLASTTVYIAGRFSDFGSSGAQTLSKLMQPRPNPDGSLAFNRAVTSLQLLWSKIGPEGASAIASALRPQLEPGGGWTWNRHLTALHLGRNHIGDAGAQALASVLAPRQDPSGTWVFCTDLADLDLIHNDIGPEGAQALAQALEPRQNADGSWVFPPLARLNLHGNPAMGKQGLLSLLESLLRPRQQGGGWVFNPNLRKIYLDGFALDDEVASEAAAALSLKHGASSDESGNRALRLLDLSTTSETSQNQLLLILSRMRMRRKFGKTLADARQVLHSFRYRKDLFRMVRLKLRF